MQDGLPCGYFSSDNRKSWTITFEATEATEAIFDNGKSWVKRSDAIEATLRLP